MTRESSALGQSDVLRETCVLAYLSRGVHLSTRSRGGLNMLGSLQVRTGHGQAELDLYYARAVYDEKPERTYGDVIVKFPSET